MTHLEKKTGKISSIAIIQSYSLSSLKFIIIQVFYRNMTSICLVLKILSVQC